MSLWAAILPAHIHPAADPDAALDHALQTVVLEPATPQQQRRDAAADLVGDPDSLGARRVIQARPSWAAQWCPPGSSPQSLGSGLAHSHRRRGATGEAGIGAP